ncbi:hypothetical protein GCM10007854_16430 [Algimonas porphyrae]|uniref:Autotransporter outer membrane beta-barrel domain-containing protein n=2 Tax=Algimonas porphyrae TaxID=1128113 RepID=A0ABQ5UZG5_9PROT|nr:hypothetical protein GCM10007854_16430 [Algimonas porphyrae]
MFDCAGDVMRLAALAFSAFLLSGCSYLGGFGDRVGGLFSGSSGQAANAPYGRSPYSTAPYDAAGRCVVTHARAPLPPGCHPSQVVVRPQAEAYPGAANPTGFPQQPQFGEPRYTSGGYGSHAGGNPYAQAPARTSAPTLRRPKFRASLDLGAERSISGNAIDYTAFPLAPTNGYQPNLYQEGRTEGSIADGAVTTYRYYADDRLQTNPEDWDDVSQGSISLSDAWSTPTTIGVGGEFILGDRATVFGRVGYTRAEGTSGGAVSVEGTVFEEATTRIYDDFVLVATSQATGFRTGQTLSEYSYDFSDMERLDLEAGGRFYLNPVAGQDTGRTVTPFLGASAGASRYNDASFTIDQRQLSYRSVYEAETPNSYDLDIAGYDLDGNAATPPTRRVALYDAQWVPSGRLSAGVEWQVTPATALAFETGLRVEGARDYSNGAKGDTNISVPLTLRGSFNF